jgi:hypothetical protein
MESAFEPKPNANAPNAINIAILSMCSSPCDDADHLCRRSTKIAALVRRTHRLTASPVRAAWVVGQYYLNSVA